MLCGFDVSFCARVGAPSVRWLVDSFQFLVISGQFGRYAPFWLMVIGYGVDDPFVGQTLENAILQFHRAVKTNNK